MHLHVCALLLATAVLVVFTHTPKTAPAKTLQGSFEGVCEETVVFLWSGEREMERGGDITSHHGWHLLVKVDQKQIET